ncbi:MAG: hypothetical protein ABH846_02870 [Patescibacteria group bacterium]
MPVNLGSTGARPMSRSLRVYQKAAIVFMIVALLLLLAVLYLSVSQATITVVPNPRVVSTTVSVEVASNPIAVGQVSGYVIKETFSKAKTFSIPADSGTPIEQKAGGKVTLINETATAQPLVATTRLLSEEGILFRIDEAVVIPANGTLETVAHADKPGLSGEIGPTQFTIPGLPGSEKIIYAVSVEPMTGGVAYVTVLEQSHLDQAADDLEKEILEEAKAVLKERFDNNIFDGAAYMTEVAEVLKSDTEPGTETGSFTVEATINVIGTFYSSTLLADYAQSELYNQISAGYDLTSINIEGLQVEVQSVDVESETASLSLYLDGMAVVSTGAEALDLDRFVGKSGEEVVTLLESSDAIESAKVEFTPFWLKRVPTLQDHVRIIVEKSE